MGIVLELFCKERTGITKFTGRHDILLFEEIVSGQKSTIKTKTVNLASNIRANPIHPVNGTARRGDSTVSSRFARVAPTSRRYVSLNLCMC